MSCFTSDYLQIVLFVSYKIFCLFKHFYQVVCNFNTHSRNIIGSASEALLEAEIDKLKPVISHKDEMIKMLKHENDILNLLVKTQRRNR